MFNYASLLKYFEVTPVNVKLKPEDSLCYEFAHFLKTKTLQGLCPYVWFHVANEGYALTTFRVRLWGQVKKSIGKFPGVADYIFLGEKKCFALEIKTKKTKQSENQKTFEKWCNLNNVTYACVHSLEEAIEFVYNYKIVNQPILDIGKSPYFE